MRGEEERSEKGRQPLLFPSSPRPKISSPLTPKEGLIFSLFKDKESNLPYVIILITLISFFVVVY